MFWERFSQLCDEHGIKPNPLAKEIGISSGIITKWKTAGTLPNGETLKKLASYFGCSVDYLLGFSEDAEKSPSISEEDQDLLATVHQLDARDQGKVLGYAESLLSADKYSVKDASRRA